MKKLNFLNIIALIIANITFAQNTSILDAKNGFMDLKIGNPIQQYFDNVTADEREENMYIVKDVSKYNIGERVIENIVIMVSKEKTIEHFSLFFTDRSEELYRLSKSTALNYDKRLESFELAKKIEIQGTDLEYYYNLFRDAFGEPTEKKAGGIKIWTGKKTRIMYINTKGDGNGIINFSIVKSDEQVKKIKVEKAQKAISKF